MTGDEHLKARRLYSELQRRNPTITVIERSTGKIVCYFADLESAYIACKGFKKFTGKDDYYVKVGK